MYVVFALLVGVGILLALVVRQYYKEEVAPRRAYHRAVRKLGRSVPPAKD